MAKLDLTTSAVAVDASVLPKLTDKERKLAVETWRGRMVNEHASAQVFAGLLPQLMRAEIDAERQAEVTAMIAEELEHARLCAGVVAALGERPVGELPEIRPLPAHEDATPLEALLRNVLSICCLSETVAVALIDAERLQLDGSVLSDVLRKILADEVGHARFGWRLLEHLELEPALAARLSDYLRVAFAHLETHELAHLNPFPAPTEACSAAGVCNGTVARKIFFETIEKVIVPRLESHGLDARRAWSERRA